MVEFLKRLIGGSRESDDGAANAELITLIKQINQEMHEAQTATYYYDLKPSDSATYKALKKESIARQTEVARFLFEHRNSLMRRSRTDRSYEPAGRRYGFAIFRSLMRGALNLTPEELLAWADELHHEAGTDHKRAQHGISLVEWPIAAMIQGVERHAKKKPLSKEALTQLQAMLDWPQMKGKSYYGTDFGKVANRISALMSDAAGVEMKLIPYEKLSGDTFGDPLEADIKAMDAEYAARAHQVLNQAASASGSKPTKVFVANAKALMDDLGKERVRKLIQDWLGRALIAKSTIQTFQHTHGNHTWEHTEERVFTDSNVVLLKGLVWMCDGFQDTKTVNLVANLCEKAMRKVPGRGPAAQATASACLWYLETTPGAEAAARLSRLGTAIKQKSVQKRVKDIVAKKAEQAGITTIQLEERVVPDYGLKAGAKTVTFGDYGLRIEVDGPGQLVQTWLKPDGSPQKTKPKLISERAALKARFTRVWPHKWDSQPERGLIHFCKRAGVPDAPS